MLHQFARILLSLIALAQIGQAAEAQIDFTRDVRPILSGRCFQCHGPDAESREAGLRLDDVRSATAELESGEKAVVPGRPHLSGLIARITSDEEYERMPPPEQGNALTEQEIATLKQWIEEGAKYDRHWSFVSPIRHSLPNVNDKDWPRNGLDYFVLNRLEQENLRPSPPADRRTLMRRLSLDLTGLPPSPDELERFLNDHSPNAYEQLVDRLLDSPRFGERWGRIWLDLARYADSAGYADDPPRVIWMYRDWVIKAINDGMPIDQFTIEQLAGDLLPDPSHQQLIATAFHRNTMTNSEGGTDDEEFRNAAIVDRVNTTMQVWMGLTMGCAQCHSHKYDPISQEEFYNVFAIFNQTEDADRRDEAPLLDSWTPDLLTQQQNLQAQIEQNQQQIRKHQSNTSVDDDAVILDGPIQARRVRISLPGRNEFLSLAEVQVFSGDRQVALNKPATQSSTDYDGPARLAVDGNTDGHYFNAKSTTHTARDDSPWWQVDLLEEFSIDRIVIWNRNDSAEVGQRLNPFRIVFFDANDQPVWARQNLTIRQEKVTINVPKSYQAIPDEDRSAIAEVKQSTSPELMKLKEEIDTIKKQLAAIKPVTTPIVRELPDENRRKTHIQIRGNFLDLGDEVQPGVLKEFHPIEVASPNRLDFANWLVSPDNPLTARVMANRHWEILFGRGLVVTSEDFGMQGELPSHPKLLDWLAVRLLDLGWSQKDFIKLIVTSATYRQQSNVSSELFARDPVNRLLARGPRFRLSAEMIRDQALSVANLLSDKMHGPSVNPPRPKLGLRAAFGGSTDWETSQGEDQYRRGIYTTWRRSIPYPSMDAFDAPSREVCTVRRIRTNTPLQALVTLNDPVYIEAAQALAGRMLTEADDSTDDRLKYGFLLCTARLPNESELNVLRQTFVQAREQFENSSGQVNFLQAKPALNAAEVSETDQAAWTVFANVLLNLDETLTRR